MKRAAKKLQAKSKLMEITQRGMARTWDVKSPSGKEYIVWAKRDKNLSCNCKFGVRNYHTNRVCSHIFAVKTHSNNWQHAELTSYWPDDVSARRQHRRKERFQDVHLTTRAAA